MNDDDRLSELLSDAVSDIEPGNRLPEIHRRTAGAAPGTRRTRFIAVGGAVLATAAVITAIAVINGQGPDTAAPGPADTTSSAPTERPTQSPSSPGPESPVPITPGGSPSDTGSPAGQAIAVYYVGDDPSGKPVLYREFHRGVADPGTIALQSLREVETQAFDPDYATAWKPGTFSGVSAAGGVITVALADASVHDRPAGMNQATAEASIQQVIYTVQAAYQAREPVQFALKGNPVDQVLGVPTSEPLSQGSALKTLSLMSISSPAESDKVSGPLTVTGVNNGFEASLSVYLERNGTRYAVTPGMSAGWQGDQLYPWTVTLDLTDVPPAKYTLVAQNDDPSGNGKAATDTRTVYVK